MVQEHLLEFIKKNLKEGYDRPRLTEVLLKNGYNQAVIDEAFTQVEIGAPVETQQQAQTTESTVPASQEPMAQEVAKDQQDMATKDKSMKNVSKIMTFVFIGLIAVAVIILLVMWMIPSDDDSGTTTVLTNQTKTVNQNNDTIVNQTLTQFKPSCAELDLTSNKSRIEESSMGCFLKAVNKCDNLNYSVIGADVLYMVMLNKTKSVLSNHSGCNVNIESRDCIMDNNMPSSGNPRVDETRIATAKKRIIASCKVNEPDTISQCVIAIDRSNVTTTLNQNLTDNRNFIEALVTLQSGKYPEYLIECS